MKFNIFKISLLFLVCIIGYSYYAKYIGNEESFISLDVLDKDKGIINSTIDGKTSRIKTLISEDVQYLVDALKPLSKGVLKSDWQVEFGCYSKTPSDNDDFNEEVCSNSYLTAASFDEALWMQRQGYPSQSQLKLLENEDNLKYLQELALKNKYTPAMAVLAVGYLNNGQYSQASNMALNLVAYSQKFNTFPHRIRGESFLAENNLSMGLLRLKVSSLLGDSESDYIFNRYIHKYPDLGVSSSDRAYLYMGRVFGVSPDQFPHDARPRGAGG